MSQRLKPRRTPIVAEAVIATSQNGYPANDRSLVSSRLIPGTQVKVTVRNGPAGDLLLYAASRWDKEVEDIDNARGALDDWGYAERPIRGSKTTLSNHASGTAIDLNATKHPLGTAPIKTFSTAQIVAARRIVADCGRALRWGGDYSGRPDPMHLEVNASEKRCAEVLAAVTSPNSSPARATLRRGSVGPDVELLQRFLGVAHVGDDGYGAYGPKTEAAVRKYQQMRGLVVDGVCGPSTWKETAL